MCARYSFNLCPFRKFVCLRENVADVHEVDIITMKITKMQRRVLPKCKRREAQMLVLMSLSRRLEQATQADTVSAPVTLPLSSRETSSL